VGKDEEEGGYCRANHREAERSRSPSGSGSAVVHSAVQQECSKKKRSYRSSSVTP
jgi:hypothetical protein